MSNTLNTITVDGVTQSMESYNSSQVKTNSNANSALDKDAFLQLMVTQLQYQDPLDPQDNSAYVAELAQFSALEQMTNVSEGITNMSKLVSNIDTSVLVGQLSSMIDKDLEWISTTREVDAEGNVSNVSTNMEGKVTGVSITDGEPTILAVSGGMTYQVSVGDIVRVGQEGASAQL